MLYKDFYVRLATAFDKAESLDCDCNQKLAIIDGKELSLLSGCSYLVYKTSRTLEVKRGDKAILPEWTVTATVKNPRGIDGFVIAIKSTKAQ